MKIKIAILYLFIGTLFSFSQTKNTLPKGFVYVKDEIPSIKIGLRYFYSYNFVGKRVHGYHANKAILSIEATKALKKVQANLQKKGLSLIIYDAYRPQKAVNHFITWAKNLNDTLTKHDFYPYTNKKDLFKLGYIASHSRHSSGSTIDVSIFSNKTKKAIDMGSPYDFFGTVSWVNYSKLTKEQKQNRQLLQTVMLKNGFRNYPKEWWHYTLKYEPYRNQYFDFDVK